MTKQPHICFCLVVFADLVSFVLGCDELPQATNNEEISHHLTKKEKEPASL